MSEPLPLEEQRFEPRASTRFVVPLAVALGLLGAALAPTLTGHLVLGGGAAAVGALWALTRARRPALLVGAEGYRVVEGRREKLRVRWDELRRVRAVPAEQAMYLDCGEPGRNLLLPTRHGFGFRFQRQSELYVLLARRLEGRLEIVDALAAPDKEPRA